MRGAIRHHPCGQKTVLKRAREVRFVSRVSAGQRIAALSEGIVIFPRMSETSRKQGTPQPRGGNARPGNSGGQAQLLPEWVREYIPLLLLGAVVLVAVLCHVATVITWPALVSALAAAAAGAAWIRYLIVRKKRAAEAARKQRELFVQSCFDKVDVMPGSPVFEHYIADLLRMDGHHDVQVVGGKGDGGADILSTDPSGRAMAYQCKRQKDPVPIKVIRELQGTLAYEHHGRAGVIVTNNTLTRDAEALARATGIAVIARAQLAEWMDRARDQIEQKGSPPREGGSRASRAPGTSSTAIGWTAVLLLVVFAVVYATASAHSAARASTHPAIAPPATQLSPEAVIMANFAAISRHDWHTVWDLWYHPAADARDYQKMISGYRLTARDVVVSMKTSGDSVSARVLAYETTGAVQTYHFTFTVHAGQITAGRSVLAHVSYRPSAVASHTRS
jgi:HJR/Mrr/RecB family endonuclease